MKANQKFAQADDAVSPVIGVILMVAITVVLAAVVFVLVNGLTEGVENSEPVVAFTKDENGNTAGGFLTVADIENGPVVLANIVLGGSSHTATACTWTNADATDLSAGDQLACTAAGTVTISDSASGKLLYSGSFE